MPSIKTPEEIVTIGLYYTESNANVREKRASFIHEQIEMIEHIRFNLTGAARHVGATPPTFILSVLLVPDWKKEENSYNNPDYLQVHEIFFREFKEALKAKSEPEKNGFELQDAYQSGATPEEQQALHKLEHLGANADWIKIRAIAAHAGTKHLQLDSNTQINNYDNFYSHTFGQDEHDALNAINYKPNNPYINAHNKVIYTIPNGKIATTLAQEFSAYCNNGAVGKNWNCFYDAVFCPALQKINLVTLKATDMFKKRQTNWGCYIANLTQPEYQLTQDIISAVNKSWDSDQALNPYQQLNSIPALKYEEAELTFPCFLHFIHVHTKQFGWQPSYEAQIFRKKLHDPESDLKMMTAYYNHAKEYQIAHPSLDPNLAGLPSVLEQLELCIPKTPLGRRWKSKITNETADLTKEKVFEKRTKGYRK